MTDESPEPAEPRPASPKAAEDDREEGSLLPAILVGGGIVLVVALFLLWGRGDDEALGPKRVSEGPSDGRPVGSQAAATVAGARGKGGVAARDVDDPSRPRGPGRVNPAVRLPEGLGMAPAPPVPDDDRPPVFGNRDEEIAWYEKKLAEAIRTRESRQTFLERLPRMRERLEQGADPEAARQTFERRQQVVEDNYEKARTRVEELEKKLASLRGS